MGLELLPFADFEMNAVWMELVLIAGALVAWTDLLVLRGELSGLEPKRLRYRALHTAGRLGFHARRATLRLERRWPWAEELAAAFARLGRLPAPHPARSNAGRLQPAGNRRERPRWKLSRWSIGPKPAAIDTRTLTSACRRYLRALDERSGLVVDQVNGRAEVRKDHIRPLHTKACSLLQEFPNIRISWIPRKWNAEADALATKALPGR
jgi:hypothetical protein